jgi:hypothetical protein
MALRGRPRVHTHVGQHALLSFVLPRLLKDLELREQYVRSLFSHLLGASFPRRRDLPWLVNASGGRMELDDYNEELGIGFEYQGPQHYGVDGFFHKTDAALERRRMDDARKMELCNSQGVTLVAVPYSIGWTGLQAYVTTELTSRGREIADSSPFPPGVISISRLELLEKVALLTLM